MQVLLMAIFLSCSPIIFAKQTQSKDLPFIEQVKRNQIVKHNSSKAVKASKQNKPSARKKSTSDKATIGIASFYAKKFHGRRTANGETFNNNALTAAHKTLPFGSKVKVINLQNRKSVVVRINDRGPFIRGRIIDLSVAAAKKIDLGHHGTARVKLELLSK